jgi:hypothetical protein
MTKQECSIYFNQKAACFISEIRNAPFSAQKVSKTVTRDGSPEEIQKALLAALGEYVSGPNLTSEESSNAWETCFKDLKQIFEIESEKDLYSNVHSFRISSDGENVKIYPWVNSPKGYLGSPESENVTVPIDENLGESLLSVMQKYND